MTLRDDMVQHGEHGYTLVELLVVIGILALVAAIATPTMTTVVRSATARADRNSLMTELLHLQDEAVRRQTSIMLMPTKKTLTASDGETVILSEGATVELAAPIRYFADGTTTGGRLVLRSGSRASEIDVAWLTGAVSAGEP